MIWCTDNPTKEGWYLCAWKMGDGYVYAVGKWSGGEWFASMSAEPHAYQEIQSPAEQDKMLDELHETQKQ